MVKIVISAGDSFTFGSELEPPNEQILPSTNSWANLVANKLNSRHINVARPGRSNSYAARHIAYQVNKALEQGISTSDILVQVMWTFTDRNEFAVGVDLNEYDSPWLALTPYTHVNENESTWFKSLSRSIPNWQSIHNDHQTLYNRNKSLGIVDFAKYYSKLVQSSALNDSYVSLKEILSTKLLLESQNIQYMFTYVNQHVMIGLLEDNIDNKYIQGYRSLLNVDWFNFPGSFQKYIGFDDWAKNNNYEYATSHPLKPAHTHASELIYNHLVKNILL
jgi:hypothetical protein